MSIKVVANVASRRPRAVWRWHGGRAIVPNGGGGGPPVAQYLRLFDVKSRKMMAEVPLRDGKPQDGNFGVLIRGDIAFVSDPVQGTIRMFDLRAFGTSPPEMLASAHEEPDGLAWSPCA